MPASAATPAPSIGAPEVVASGISMATGVAPLANGDLLVSDYLGNAVDDFRGGAVVATYGGSLLAPHGLALASNGDAYVANFGTRGTPVADGTVSRLPLGVLSLRRSARVLLVLPGFRLRRKGTFWWQIAMDLRCIEWIRWGTSLRSLASGRTLIRRSNSPMETS